MQTTNTRSEFASTTLANQDYIRWFEVWKTLNDTVDGGADTIKTMSQRYLPATSGQVSAWSAQMPGVTREMISDTQWVDSNDTAVACVGQGAYSYFLYKTRAVFYEYPSATVQQMVGRLTSEPPTEINLPAELDAIQEVASTDGEDLERVIEVIFNEQCKYSRCGVLADFPQTATVKPPYLTVYGALRVTNWNVIKDDTGEEVLQWVVLDESQFVQDDLASNYDRIWRICALDEQGNYFTELHNLTGLNDNQIKQMTFLKPGPDAVYPMFKGNYSNRIPFTFINATNVNASPELPILNTVSEMSLAIYRGEADYRQALFVQGQSTPAFTGATPEEASKFLLGANGAVASQSPDFKAYYMEVSGNGLEEMRESQTNLHNLAKEEGMKLINAGKQQSGDALDQVTNSQTVTLELIASACQDGLEKLLSIVAEWGGITGEVEIKLNREFSQSTATPDDLLKMTQAFNSGAPITKEDIHRYSVEGGLIESEWEEVQENLDMTGRNALQIDE